MINSSVAFQVNYIPPEITSCKYLSITAKYVFWPYRRLHQKSTHSSWLAIFLELSSHTSRSGSMFLKAKYD